MKKIYTAALACLFSFTVFAQPVVGFQSAITGFTQPLDIVHAGDSRLFIVEQGGKIKIWNGTAVLATPFLDVSSIITYDNGGERGLLSLAFHPNYATNRYFFIYYNNAAGNVTLARYQTKAALPNEADPASGVTLMTFVKPFTNHNGCKLNFGPDGYLYFGTGDGGSGGDPNNNAQTGTSYLGKMLRIDVNNFTAPPYYSIPPTNPYLTDAGINDEIIAVGLRNPFRWSFDRLTGDMWIADVGQDLWEEVNVRPAAGTMNLNYGWRCFEGTHVYNSSCTAQPNNVVPIFEYPHNNTTGGFSIIGGYVYRGPDYPFFQGYYICADYVSKNFWLIKPNGSGGWTTTQSATQTPANISGFGEDQNGVLYAAGLNNGVIYKVTAAAAVPLKLVSFTGKKINGLHQLDWSVQSQQAGDRFIMERGFDNTVFTEVGNQAASNDRSVQQYSMNLAATAALSTFYRIKLVDANGHYSYSPIIRLSDANMPTNIKAYKSGSSIVVSSGNTINSVQVMDISGRVLFSRDIHATGSVSLDGSQFPQELLLIKVMHADGISVLKLIN